MARFYQALVVCGAGLTALHCGGKTESSGSTLDLMPPDAGDGGASDRGGIGVPDADAELADAWWPSDASIDGAQAQWTCEPGPECVFVASANHAAFELSDSPCETDTQRPISAAACDDGERFTCLLGSMDGELVPFNCECVVADSATRCSCPWMAAGCLGAYTVECAPATVCGCAFTCIAR